MINLSTPFQDFDCTSFLRDFLPEDLILSKEDLVKQPYQKYITHGGILGTVKSLNLSIIEFKQSSENDPRVSLAKEAFRIMADHRIRRWLVIFWNPRSKNWRLSLMTINLDIDEKNKIVRNYSNAKRFSFLLWEGEAMKTPRIQLSKRVDDFEDLQKRFSVEVVRKEFFDDYIDLFIRLYIDISNDEWLVKVLADQNTDRVKFTKNLLGKIIFVYFVQKKWWLGLDRDGTWWNGDKNFMRSLWDRFDSGDTFVRPSTDFFYNDYLEHLFYNGFNKDRRDDEAYEPNMRMKVPYLNGGLFREDYRDWEHFTAKVSNDIFSNGKDGILDVFDTYNFTIDEDDLTDAEIAVDPEMLGKIFEKMISVSNGNIDEIVALYKEKWKVKIGTELNKKFGAFYTPREIVHYMTRESLVAYLATNISGKKELNEAQIRSIIDAKDQHLSRVETIQLFGKDTSDMSIFTNELDTLLQKVKIIDPAVGSGAFPMGILHEITTLRYYLHSEGFCTVHKYETEDGMEELTEDGHISMYHIKRETIKNSIYGVDIEPGAIDIARLRFWLSLVVDAEHPEPLPNFEFKFICANTLIPLAEEIEKNQTALDLGKNELNLKTLRKYMTEYYNADNKIKKKQLEERINSYVALDGSNTTAQTTFAELSTPRRLQLANFHPFNSNHSNTFFDASLMMWEGRGFDIVIGNPPYIWYKWNSDLFSQVKKTKIGNLYYQKEMDYWYYFAHIGLDILMKKWFLTFITTSYWKTASWAKKLREKIKENFLSIFIDFWEKKIFENASWQHNCIFMVWKSENHGVKILKESAKELNEIFDTGNIINYKNSFFDENNCIFFNNEKNREILKKVKEWQKLWTMCRICSWIKTGADKVSNKHTWKYILNRNKWDWIFVLNKNESEKFLEKWLEKSFFGDFYKNSDIWKYYVSESKYKLLLALDENDLKNSIVYDHLVEFKEILFQRKARFGSLLDRLDLNFKKEDTELYKNTGKIVVPYRWSSNKFTYLDTEFYSTEDVYYISKPQYGLELPYVLSLLNSQLYNFFLKFSSKIKGWMVEYTTWVLKQIPIKIPHDQKPFITLVDQILSAKKLDPKADTKELERKIDGLVYLLYGLTEEEIGIVEDSN